MRLRLLTIGCVVLASFGAVQTAWAVCTCKETWPAGAFADSQAVFQGTVLSVDSVVVGERRWQEARLRMERAWKGVSDDVITVRTPAGNRDACGIDFWVGDSYVVYAESDAGGTLFTGRCQRTEFTRYAEEDLQYLENRMDSSPQPGEVFSDVPTDHPNFQAVTALYGASLVTGYRDGTFRPEKSVSRAEIVKVLIDAAPGYRIRDDVAFQDPYDSGWLKFSDVSDGEWYVPFLRKAVQGKLVKGYRDGTFRPSNSVSVAEASKMIAIAFGLTREWDGPVWYEQYVAALGDRHAIPVTIASVNAPLTRGELAEIVWRVRENIRTRESKTADEVSFRTTCQPLHDSVAGIDMQRVRDAWLEWYNIERATLGLKAYVGSSQLDRTAYEWSDAQADDGSMDHRRSGQAAGSSYDYALMRRWFSERGLGFANQNGSTFTENIGWGPFRCDQVDCTDELIAAMRQTFDFYQKEREQAYHPHWNTVVNPDFRLLGLGIALRDGKYFLTTHIATEIVSEPPALCR